MLKVFGQRPVIMLRTIWLEKNKKEAAMAGKRSTTEISGVEGFKLDSYLGTWFEIARIDFRFERNLNNTTAEYTLRDDGKVNVVNRGYNPEKNEWKMARGKARFRGRSDKGELEVSFFGPFYAQYNVVMLDKDYSTALVAGKNTDYLWILSREKRIADGIKEALLKKASDLGYDTSRLIWVVHDEKK